MTNTFSKDDRLRKSAEFDAVYADNAYAADGVLVILGRVNGLDRTRLGLSVSRRVGNAAVRNRWKRLIRNAFRTQLAELPVGLDLVARPKKGAQADHDAICRSLPKLVDRIHRRLTG